MPRDLPIGNGALLVNFDACYQVRDLYWPFVGQENHTAGHPLRFGVWADGRFGWTGEAGWRRTLTYLPNTLLTDVTLTSLEMGITLHCQDTVDFHANLYLRQVTVENLWEQGREVRLFFAQDFHISGSEVGDSAYYEPERQAVYHYKGQRWFLINTARESTEGWQLGVSQWAVGLTEVPGHEGTWRDAEDGVLSGNAVAQGSVDSCVAVHATLPARGQATVWYWIAVGESFDEVTRLNRMVREKGPRAFLQRTRHYWALWLAKEIPQALARVQEDPLYQRALLTIRTHIDNDGAIVAATDYAIAQEAHDTYCYMWPRDGALIAAALVGASYPEVSRRFFTFCHEIITQEGYLLHKYNPDGSLASSWIGWYYQGRKELPVQEDETALVLWALRRHFEQFHDVEDLKPLYRGLIIRAANWLAAYRDEQTGLPLPSWDLWEERRGIHAWTVGAVWGGLQAAAYFAEAFGEQDLAVTYRAVARAMREAVEERFWDAAAGHFRRAALVEADGHLTMDATPDASIAGLWLFGMFPPDDPRMVATMTTLRERLWVNTPIGGLARYANDLYQRVSQDFANVPGNPWFICTLWWARWYAEVARTPEDLARSRQLLDWVHDRALPSGILAEQLHPYTGIPLSVCPLTWSHAEYVMAVQAYWEAQKRLGAPEG